MTTCPVSSVDPFAADFLADPYPTLAALREESPVVYSPALDMWIVTRHADIDAIFRDHETYSATIVQDPIHPPADEARAVLAAGGFKPTPTMSNVDPPKHTRIRRHNLRSFSARRIASLEPRIRDRAAELIDVMLMQEEFDVVTALTFPLPAYMIFTFLGFPAEDIDLLKGWCGNRAAYSWGRPTIEEQVEIAGNMVAYWQYCERFADQRIAEPLDDFTSDLARVHNADPDELSRAEITGIAYALSFAGHETTTNLTTNALRRLLENREQWDALCKDPALIPNAVEEALRHDTSVIAWRRITTRPVQIGGVDVPEGARLMLSLASANRDPAQFENPDTFDVQRSNARDHLAFGMGIHFCLGAPLARIEVRTVLELLTERAPNLRLVPDQGYDYPPNMSFRGPRELHLTRR